MFDTINNQQHILRPGLHPGYLFGCHETSPCTIDIFINADQMPNAANGVL